MTEGLVAASEHPFRVRLDETERGFHIVRLSDGETLGEIVIEEDSDGPWIPRMEVVPEHRGFGAGSEAAWLLAEALRTSGIERIRAWAPPDAGLAVYFWSRMGFRPLHGPGPHGGIWFERTLGPRA
jgi:GNAT superfamily N-acetyltransferase